MSFSSTLSTEDFDVSDLPIHDLVDYQPNIRFVAIPITPPSSNNTLPIVKRIAKRKVRHYERQRNEKDVLHSELARLSRLLRREETMKKMKSATQNEQKALGWKAVAKWSLEERQVSEANRQWLLAAISGKKALIEDLKSVVRQHMLLVNATSRSCRHTALFHDPPDDIVFVIDMQDIDNLYRQTDSIFNTCGLDSTSTKTTTFQQTVTKDNDGVSIRLVRRQHFLFGYKHTWQSVWMLSHMMHRQEDREDYGGIEDPENTIATKFRITKQLPGGTRVSLKERFVVRKFEETNRTIIIWKASLTGEGSFSGMQTELTGWSIIRPSTTDSGCVVDVCMLHVPLHLKNPDVAPDIMADRFSEFLQSIIQENSQEITSGSKALLLEHMLTGIDL